jgi:hypothetical protein
MNLALLPTVLWTIVMVTGAIVSVRVLIRMQRRQAVQRQYRTDDVVLAEVARRNVAFAWLLTDTLLLFAVAGFVSIAGQIAAGPDDPVPPAFRWAILALLSSGGATLSAVAVREDRHAVRVHQLAAEAETLKAQEG